MDTFRKFLFIFDSRRPGGGLLIKQEKTGITEQKILLTLRVVKGKNASKFGD